MMKIYLKNFKSWEYNSFEFDYKGIQLLSGESGKGKSSILDAIYFCLYGELQKITTYGKNSCEVKIEYRINDTKILIIRSKRPNRLVVERDNEKYEDEEAQTFINNFFGEYFMNTSYIRQNNYKTFLYMSSTEKLDFLEDCSLKKYDIEGVKRRLRDYIKNNEKSQDELRGKINTYTEILKQTSKPDKILYPIKCGEKNIDKISKNERIKLKNYTILLKKNKRNFDKNNSLLINLSSKIGKLEELNKNLILSNENTEKYKNLIFELSYDEKILNLLNEKYEKYKIFQENQKLKQQLESERQQYGEELSNEIKRLKDKLENLNLKLETYSIQSTPKELENKLESLSRDYQNALKYESLSSELDLYDGFELDLYKESDLSSIENEIYTYKQKLSKKVYNCPNCSCQVIFTGENIQLPKEKIDFNKINEELKKLENNKVEIKNYLKKLEKYKILDDGINKLYEPDSTSEEISLKMKEMSKIISEVNSLNRQKEEIIKVLETQNFPSLQVRKRFIDNLTAKVSKFSHLNDQDDEYKSIQLEDIIEQINREKIKHTKHTEYNSSITYHNNLIIKYQREINEINREVVDFESLKTELKQNENDIKDYETKILNSEEIVKQIELYEKNCEEIKKYQEILNKKEQTQTQLDILHKEAVNLDLLKNKINQAESIAVTNFIEIINSHVQIYLERFFKSDPIQININTEKEVKNKGVKNQIVLDIEYKGHKTDLLNLSGGERDRVNLAFTLAFSEIFQSPILMLDECISSLDYDNCTNVIETLKEEYKGKMVICVHHQANEGLFDKVIRL